MIRVDINHNDLSRVAVQVPNILDELTVMEAAAFHEELISNVAAIRVQLVQDRLELRKGLGSE